MYYDNWHSDGHNPDFKLSQSRFELSQSKYLSIPIQIFIIHNPDISATGTSKSKSSLHVLLLFFCVNVINKILRYLLIMHLASYMHFKSQNYANNLKKNCDDPDFKLAQSR